MFKKTHLCSAILIAFGGTAFAQDAAPATDPNQPQATQRVEITGSRIKRAQAEGSLPVTVITREELDKSGAVTVAEFIRNSTFASTGNFRPQSGSSAQSFSEVNLRGLGSERTLVLVDGRRVAKAPNVGSAADMMSIPMAAVERIEILTDGASAIYGSDAIGGVVNFILRKDFDGVLVTAGRTKTNITGGDREEASATFGVVGDRGSMLAGLSHSSRDIIYVRDYPWGYTPGASSYANGMYAAIPDGAGGFFPNISSGGYLGAAGSCDFADKGFYIDATGRCRYDFNLVAADEAASSATSFFARGEYKINDDWSTYLVTSVTRKGSFGRYAPVPDSVLITPGSVFDQQHLNVGVGGDPYFLAHRFAAAGNRDTTTSENLYDMGLGVRGALTSNIDVDFGARRTVSKYLETGTGFIVAGLATAAINDGSYNVDDPFANSDEVLKGISHTTVRQGLWAQNELYGSVTFNNLFNVGMGGGGAGLFLSGEYRTEKYADIYDSLSEAGQVLGSAGNSATGSRKVGAASAELLVPITKELEGTLAARYEKYSDYGNDFSPKASLKYQPIPELSLRASVGRGFRAPTLPELNSKPAFSADSVVDFRTCMADGGFTADQCNGLDPDIGLPSFQINGLVIANPNLTSEKSRQYSFGATWDVLPEVSIKADYWNTVIDGQISALSAQDIVDRDNGDDPREIPAGLSIVRASNGQILQVVRGSANEGKVAYSGLDVDVDVRYKLDEYGSMQHNLRLSRILKANDDGTELTGIFGFPKQRATLSSSWKYGDFGLTWNVNYIGPNGDEADGTRVPSWVTHDLQGTWDTPLKGFKVALGVVNAGGKLPVLIDDGTKPFNYSLYDAYGRQVYVRISQKF